MARQVNFTTGTIVTAAFLNARQEVDSALAFGVRLERASSSQIQLVPVQDGSATGQSSVMVNGQPRWWTTAIVKTVSGAKATYSVYVTAGESTTLEATDITLTSGAAPANSRKIGEIDWSGSAIERIRQTAMGSVSGAQVEDGALSSSGTAVEWEREPSGAWVPLLKANSVGSNQIVNGAVTSPKAKLTAGVVKLSETIALTGAYKDVPSTTLEITPTVPSNLKITASFTMNLRGIGAIGTGTMSLDGVDQALQAKRGNGGGTDAWLELTATQVYLLSLTAAKHTIKMRCKGEGEGILVANGTAYLYELTAS